MDEKDPPIMNSPKIFAAAFEELGVFAKCIYKNLRKLKKHSVFVADILKALMNLTSVNTVSDHQFG